MENVAACVDGEDAQAETPTVPGPAPDEAVHDPAPAGRRPAFHRPGALSRRSRRRAR
jgi:hypothetical protein